MLIPSVVLGILLSAGVAAEAEPKGDPAIGRALFTGEQAFANGGAPCGSCHAMGGQPGLSASFGPDLATSKASLDPDILDGVMADQPYRTMKPLYAAHKISALERAHVAAWVSQVAGKQPAGSGAIFAVQAALIAGLLFALVAGRRSRPGPREQLERQARRVEGGPR